VEDQSTKRRWGTEQRLEFIDFCLFWEGGVNRSDLITKFGVSTPQASADLTHYRGLAPDNLVYDASAKRYQRTVDFKPRFIMPNAERYLAQLRAVSEQVISRTETWFGELPDMGVTPVPARRVDAETLRRLLAAIRERRSISIMYQSLNDARPDPAWRQITPHALGSDGLRWHVRAFCHIEHKFKDFIISRCLSMGAMDAPGADGSEDKDWSTFFKVVLVPNPKLSTSQQLTIERDYGMEDGRCEMPVRRAMLYYLDKRLRLDVAEKQDRPKETPIVVANRDEYDAALKGAAY
jgi:hypothetical protein